MKIRIISRDNGWGLSRDYAVLREAILLARPDALVEFLDWQARPSGVVDAHFYLELIPSHLFGLARRNVAVPNPEWFPHGWLPLLRKCSEVWAKTGDCEHIFSRHHRKVVRTGWTSPDRWLDVPKDRKVVHLAGASSAKGTREVLQAMALLPDIEATVVWKESIPNPPPNVRVHGNLDESLFRSMQASSAIHLCPSSYEGFGHYVNEARSVGACIIGTNAEPMTDLVRKEYAIGAAVASTSLQHLAVHKHVSAESLAECIRVAWNAPTGTLDELGRRARSAYLSDRAGFHARVAELLA